MQDETHSPSHAEQWKSASSLHQHKRGEQKHLMGSHRVGRAIACLFNEHTISAFTCTQVCRSPMVISYIA